MEQIKSLKRKLRKDVRAQRAQLPAEVRAAWDEQIFENLRTLPEYRRANSVFCYISYGTEPSTMPILEDVLKSGKKLLVPRLNDRLMELVEVDSLSGMVPGWNGILEPDKGLPATGVDAIDFAVIPALACTEDGVRLGQGGGYYDGFLSKYPGPFALILHAAFVIPGIPAEEHDMPIKKIVTERGIIET